ncbi:MAG: NINE protein [Terracidiphilus sp.]|nr:NINE protein [Terracidiphilus sp.]
MGAYNYPNPQAIFYQQFQAVRRDEVVGVLLALFLGGFGAHHFYLRRTDLGVLYLLFFWTPFPWILGFIECFFMPGRVREFNAIQAAALAAFLSVDLPPTGYPTAYPATASATDIVPASAAPAENLLACPRCQNTNPANARFCSSCGAQLN